MSTTDPERFLEARRLIDSGDYQAATKFCVMLWREGDFHERTLTVRKLLPKLVASHPPARDEDDPARTLINAAASRPPLHIEARANPQPR